jgi:GNAT superfamily N-acetyltransferase
VIAVWRAEPHEAEAVARLIVEFRDHLGLDWPSPNAFLAGVERLIEKPDTAFLLGAPDEDAPPSGVAQVRFRFGLWWAAEDCLLEDLFVRDDARGRGVGRALVEAVVALATERGCRRVELDVNEANAAAFALYESFGFSAQDDRYGGRNVLMRLHLERAP